MISAELSHNPYLLQTTVKFNGQIPRINSQVEKYESVTLKDWIEKVPKIFHDEMNGYDFELSFTGTKSDFESLQRIFQAAGISQDMVRLFHKNELEDAETKSLAIDRLIQWLRENPNRKFDFAAFYEQNTDLFESAYPYIIINGHSTEAVHPQVSAEVVKNAQELQNTVLTNTPILFFIDPKSTKEFREDLVGILNRKDVRQNQLFFMIHPQLKADQVRRVITDLGVEHPQIVSTYSEEAILMYFRDYPITEYVRDAIIIFEEKATAISAILAEENKASEIQNAEIHAVIDGIEEQLRRLKESDTYFTERDNFFVGSIFDDLLSDLQSKIEQWRNRKTKVVGDDECDKAATEYNIDVAKYIAAFNTAMSDAYRSIAMEIHEDFIANYKKQGLDLAFDPKGVAAAASVVCPVIPLAEDLVAMKEVTFEDKYDLMSFLRLAGTKEEKEPVRVVTCYYAQWRKKVLDSVVPVAQDIIRQNIERLTDYYNALAEAFHVHLAELIETQEHEKDKVSAQLSDDERMLQEDNDWFAEFQDQLTHIERG